MMRYNEIITESSRASLWHALKVKHASHFLSLGFIEGRTWQRYWADGRRRTEHEPDYEDSFLMKGISTTRNRRFARKWSDVVFELDWATIQRNYKIIPYSWGFHMNKPGEYTSNHKREQEEFVVTSFLEKTYDQMKQEYFDERDRLENEAETSGDWTAYDTWKKHSPNYIDHIQKPAGKPINLNQTLLGITIDAGIVSIYGETNVDVKYVLSHPKFRGAYTINPHGSSEPKSDEVDMMNYINQKYVKSNSQVA